MIRAEESTSDALLRAAEKLPKRQFDRFVNGVLFLRARRSAPTLPPTESKLMLRINRAFPKNDKRRLAQLIQKQQDRMLTRTEHTELLRLSDRLETLNAERAEALAELARLRGKPLPELMESLGIRMPRHG